MLFIHFILCKFGVIVLNSVVQKNAMVRQQIRDEQTIAE